VFVDPSITDSLAMQEAVAQTRLRYANYLNEHSCLGDYIGQIVPRNTCRNPWYNRLDARLSKRVPVVRGQSAELTVDLFNILNGINEDWGRYVGIRGDRLNLLQPRGARLTTDESGVQRSEVLYTVPEVFAQRQILGFDLNLQFSAQIGLRYSF